MSRIGKKPIVIPEGVEVKIENQKITVKGPKGELTREIRSEIRIEIEGKKILTSPQKETPKESKLPTGQAKKTKAFWGLTRALIANMIKGVTEGYEKKLKMEGLGYRVYLDGENLILEVGFTNPIQINCPPDINFSVEKNLITVSGIDKQLVGQIAAQIRKVRVPEPYKGKGIRYEGEIVRKKAGKKAVGTAG